MNGDIEALQEALSVRRVPSDFFLGQPKERRTQLLGQYTQLRPEVLRQVMRVANATTSEEFESAFNQTIAEIREKMQAVEKSETEGTVAAFAVI